MKFVFSFLIMIGTALAFRSIVRPTARLVNKLSMATIVDGVDFDTIAREWRLKWSPDNDKKSLASAQQTLVVFQSALKAIPGVKSVQRIVCGGCMDYKIIVALPIDSFKAWEAKGFAPETDVLAALKAIPGVTNIETQTYTISPVVL